jgi:translocation and assembly module TamA
MKFWGVVWVAISIASRGVCFAQGDEPCPNLHFTVPINPGLSDLEKRLACGAPSGEKDTGPEYATIPESQRKFHISTFLQARGYQKPQFEIRNGVLWVEPGTKRTVTALRVDGSPPKFDFTRKRFVVGEVLTPKLLDEVKSWTVERLRSLGYACPHVELTADPESGIVSVTIRPNERDLLTQVLEEDVPGLIPGIFSRYDAFEIGNWFNGDLATLTEHRIVNEGQVESYKLRVDHCEGDHAFLRQDVVPGKARVLTFGFGANTEGVLVAQAEWKNTRLGPSASYLDFSIDASSKEQILDAYMNWYLVHSPTRFFLKPQISSDHENLDPYETITIREGIAAQTTFDTQDVGFQFASGPVDEYVDTLRGVGSAYSHFLFLETSLKTMSHYFEYYQPNPRTGFYANLLTDLSDRKVFSDVYAERFQLDLEGLWNLNNYDPPLLIFGLRGTVATTETDTGGAYSATLPPTLRHYLGGSQTLRGFGLLELPEDQVGRLSSAFASFEVRMAHVLPVGIQPFVFVDVGALGANAFDLDDPIFWSPGFGLRLQTPIGNFRATLAHGYVSGNADPAASHLQFFLSYGEEF